MENWELQYEYRGFKALVGKKITSLKTNPEHTYLVFKTEDEQIGYYSDGDCCSSSWFENISGLECLLGHTVKEVLEREMPESYSTKSEPDEDGYQYDIDYIQLYGWTLVTDKGRFDIEMRNSSNGYYGGSADWVTTWPEEELKTVKKDF